MGQLILEMELLEICEEKVECFLQFVYGKNGIEK